MDQDELLRVTAASIERLGMKYFVTGSMASVMYGEPRFTNDIDVVVQFPESQFYVSREAARDAIRHQLMFNVLHSGSGLKIDVIPWKADAFGRSQLERRIEQMISPREGDRVWFASPEDVILNKLLFHREGGSDKHLRDITGIIKAGTAPLQHDYIIAWAKELEVLDLWESVQRRASDPR